MKYQYLLSLLAAFLYAVLAQAQTPYVWQSFNIPSCQAGTFVTSNDLSWTSSGCVDVELAANYEDLKFTQDSGGGWIRSNRTVTSNMSNVLPGTIHDAGLLSWSVKGDTAAILMGDSRFTISLYQTNGDVQNVTVPFEEGRTTYNCPQLVAGGSRILITSVNMTTDWQWPISTPFDLSFDYTYTLTGNTTITDVSVPDTDFNGTTYEYTLPQGGVYVLPAYGVFDVGLENNTANEQVINIYKTGGELIVGGDADVHVQESIISAKPHKLNVYLDSVDICLGQYEFTVKENASLTLNNVPISYSQGFSCLGTQPYARIVIAKGASQTFGEQGRGMHLWGENSVTEIQEDATLTLENNIYIMGEQDIYFDVLSGATLNVTSYTSIFNNVGRTNQFVVRLHDGGTFNMLEAPLEVQDLFRVQLDSSNQNLMPNSTFSASPNPTHESGLTYVRAGTESRQLAQIEVIDLAGRVISTEIPTSSYSFYPVRLPSSGLHVLRLTDVDGHVGHLRVVAK